MNIWVRIVAGLGGFLIQVLVLDAAIRTFLLPRVANVRLSRFASKAVSKLFRLLARPERSYLEKDRNLSLFASTV